MALLTLAEAVFIQVRQHALIGQHPGARCQIDIAACGRATLIMGWRADDSAVLRPALPDDPTVAGPYVIGVNLDALPPGIEVLTLDYPPDTRNEIRPPEDVNLRAAARRLGARRIERATVTHPIGTSWLDTRTTRTTTIYLRVP